MSICTRGKMTQTKYIKAQNAIIKALTKCRQLGFSWEDIEKIVKDANETMDIYGY